MITKPPKVDKTVDTIITGRWIIRNSDAPVLSDHGIGVGGGKIVDIAPISDMRKRYKNATIVGDDRFAVLPGFINAHHHSFGVGSIMRGVQDQTLEPWIVEMGEAPCMPKDIAAKLTAASLLRSGVTTTVDMCGAAGSIDEFTNGIRAAADGYRTAGIRAILAPGMRTQNLLSQADGEDTNLIESLPGDLSDLVGAILARERPAMSDYISCIEELITNLNDRNMTEVWYGPPGPQWVGMDAFALICDAAKSNDTRIQTHALESFAERLEGPRSLGQSRIAALAAEDLLTSRLSLAHMVWASDRDIELVAHHRVAISHNPSSNLRLRAGIAPLSKFMNANISVGLGLDGTSLADDNDMFSEIRLAANLQNADAMRETVLTPGNAYDLATRGSAKVIGRSGSAGEIAIGMPADLIVVELEKILWPWVHPDVNPLDLIVARGKSSDINHVMVNGEWRLWDRQVLGFDLDELGAEAAEHLTSSLPRPERRDRCRVLAQNIGQWHRSWEQDELEPHSVYNSRL